MSEPKKDSEGKPPQSRPTTAMSQVSTATPNTARSTSSMSITSEGQPPQSRPTSAMSDVSTAVPESPRSASAMSNASEGSTTSSTGSSKSAKTESTTSSDSVRTIWSDPEDEDEDTEVEDNYLCQEVVEEKDNAKSEGRKTPTIEDIARQEEKLDKKFYMRCYNCWGKNHVARDCPNPPHCHQCGGRHYTMLCDEQYESEGNMEELMALEREEELKRKAAEFHREEEEMALAQQAITGEGSSQRADEARRYAQLQEDALEQFEKLRIEAEERHKKNQANLQDKNTSEQIDDSEGKCQSEKDRHFAQLLQDAQEQFNLSRQEAAIKFKRQVAELSMKADEEERRETERRSKVAEYLRQADEEELEKMDREEEERIREGHRRHSEKIQSIIGKNEQLTEGQKKELDRRHYEYMAEVRRKCAERERLREEEQRRIREGQRELDRRHYEQLASVERKTEQALEEEAAERKRLERQRKEDEMEARRLARQEAGLDRETSEGKAGRDFPPVPRRGGKHIEMSRECKYVHIPNEYADTRKVCTHCHQRGHLVSFCPESGSLLKSKTSEGRYQTTGGEAQGVYCFVCTRHGHSRDECRWRHKNSLPPHGLRNCYYCGGGNQILPNGEAHIVRNCVAYRVNHLGERLREGFERVLRRFPLQHDPHTTLRNAEERRRREQEREEEHRRLEEEHRRREEERRRGRDGERR